MPWLVGLERFTLVFFLIRIQFISFGIKAVTKSRWILASPLSSSFPLHSPTNGSFFPFDFWLRNTFKELEMQKEGLYVVKTPSYLPRPSCER